MTRGFRQALTFDGVRRSTAQAPVGFLVPPGCEFAGELYFEARGGRAGPPPRVRCATRRSEIAQFTGAR